MNNHKDKGGTLVSRIFLFAPKFAHFLGIGILILASSACGPSPEVAKFKEQAEVLKRELDVVTLERNSLRTRVMELSNTPSLLFAKVAEHLGEGKLKDADIALQTIKEKSPRAPETTEAQKLVDAMRLKLDKQQEEARRLEALGFKALKTSAVVDTGEVKMNVGALNFTKQFTFDRYDSSYHYLAACRTQHFKIANFESV